MNSVVDHNPVSTREWREMAASLGVEFVDDLSARPACAQFVERIPIAFARKHRMLGLADGGVGSPPTESGDPSVGEAPTPRKICVAVSDLTDPNRLQIIARFLGR